MIITPEELDQFAALRASVAIRGMITGMKVIQAEWASADGREALQCAIETIERSLLPQSQQEPTA